MRSLLFLFIPGFSNGLCRSSCSPYLNGLVKLPYAIKTRKTVINFMHVSHVLLAVDIR